MTRVHTLHVVDFCTLLALSVNSTGAFVISTLCHSLRIVTQTMGSTINVFSSGFALGVARGHQALLRLHQALLRLHQALPRRHQAVLRRRRR
jgi:hypothetical protein